MNHVIYVFEEILFKTKCELYLVAHSAAGYCMANVIEKNIDACVEQIKLIAFTDAVLHTFDQKSPKYIDWAQRACISYDASNKPLGTKLKQ